MAVAYEYDGTLYLAVTPPLHAGVCLLSQDARAVDGGRKRHEP